MVDIGALSLERKVGQLFQVGFHGTDATGTVRELIDSSHVGGVILFDRNLTTPWQVADLSDSLQDVAQAASGVPLLVSVDQEGGLVSRLPFGPRPPGAMAVGATGDPGMARELGAAVGGQLRALGINANLAPVLDVDTNPENPVIGTRSFGSDPEHVGAFGAAAAEGLQSRGVVACAKHFPGHGDTAMDSHHGLPVVDHDRDRLDRVELVPFRRAVAADVDAIMTAHVAVPAVDPEVTRPATLSRRVLTGLLREELGYDGVILTDCMEMDAIADGVGTVEGAVRAIGAGADAVLISHTPNRQRAAIEGVVDAVRDGTIPESRVDEAARRVLSLKERRLGGERDTSAHEEVARVERTSLRTGREAVTLVRDEGDHVPLSAGPVTILAFAGSGVSPVEECRSEEGPLVSRLAEMDVDVCRHRLGQDEEVPDVSCGSIVAVTRDAATVDWQAAAVERVLDGEVPVIVLAVRNPYDALAVPAEATVLTTYDDSPAMLRAAGDVLTGHREPRGRSPVALS